MPDVVTRFAPSPTGFMHIGGVRTALFAFLLARKHGGTFILRIEDTDKEREVPGSIEHIMESLKWLNLEWDYGPDKPGPWGSTIQSERLDSYLPFAKDLIARGLAYADPYTKEEVEGFREKSKAAGKPFLFRDYRPENPPEWNPGMALRLRTPTIKRYRWHDEVRGDLEAGEEALDDFILIKSDGYPTYNFSHIIDDHLMGVTHIIRTDEFVASTPKFLSLYEALGIERPIFATAPPILRNDKTKKLGKRDGAKDVLDYRAEGYLPEAMINFLALIGWNPGTEQEKFSREELIAQFSLDRIQRAGALFNEEKLGWLNREHIKTLPSEKQLAYVIQFLPEPVKNLPGYHAEILNKALPTLLEHIEKFDDVRVMGENGELDYLFSRPKVTKELLMQKLEISPEEVKKHIEHVKNVLSNFTGTISKEAAKEALWEYATEAGRANVLWPMRVALTGLAKSPDPFTVVEILGQTESLERLTNAQNI